MKALNLLGLIALIILMFIFGVAQTFSVGKLRAKNEELRARDSVQKLLVQEDCYGARVRLIELKNELDEKVFEYLNKEILSKSNSSYSCYIKTARPVAGLLDEPLARICAAGAQEQIVKDECVIVNKGKRYCSFRVRCT